MTLKEELENNDVREVLHLHPFLAPYKVCILPLVKKYHSEKAMEIYKELSKSFATTYDESGNIGKRYGDPITDANVWSDTIALDTARYYLRKNSLNCLEVSLTAKLNPFFCANNDATSKVTS